MSTRISVIVPTLGRQAIVERFIDSLNRQTIVPTEFICVDASTERSDASYRQRLRPDIQLQYLHSQPGLTIQRNIGVRAAVGDFIFFFDDDIVLDPKFIQGCLGVFERSGNDDVGVVFGSISNMPIIPTSGLRRVHWLINDALANIFFLSRRGNGRFRASGMPTFVIGQDHESDCECMPGGLTAYRREVFSDFKFDEHLSRYSYMEDDDTGARLSKKYRIVYTPGAHCEHRHASGGRLSARAVGKMLIVNHHYLWRKNFPHRWLHRLAHIWSLIGYPLLQLWNLQPAKSFGALQGLGSIIWRRDPLSQLDL